MPTLKQHIVVVDDDPEMNLAIERLLKAAGFKTASFLSAEAFLEAGMAESAACLVLDVHLPGLSGFDLRRRLQQDGMEPPVIFITAYEDSASRAQAQAARAVAFLGKPFPRQTFLLAIGDAIRLGAGEDSEP